MYGRTYEPKRVFRKKTRRAFPKELVEEVSDGDDLFSALFASNIKEIRQKAKANVDPKSKRKEKKTGRVTTLRNLSVVQELSEPSHCKDSDKENAVESTFDEIFRGPRYQNVRTSSHGKSTPASPGYGCSSSQKSGKSTNTKKVQRATRQRKLNGCSRVLRSHESQPNANDSYLNHLNDDETPPFRGRTRQLSKNKLLSLLSSADSKASETVFLNESSHASSQAAVSAHLGTSLLTVLPGNGFQVIANEVDEIQSTTWTPLRNGSYTKDEVTSTPALVKFRNTLVKCDLSPIVSPESGLSPEDTVKTSLYSDVILDSPYLSPFIGKVRGLLNGDESSLNSVKRDLPRLNCSFSSPDIFAEHSLAEDIKGIAISARSEMEKSAKSVSGLSNCEVEYKTTEEIAEESVSHHTSLTETRSRSVEKTPGKETEDGSEYQEVFASPDPFGSNSYHLRDMRRREPSNLINSPYDRISGRVKKGGRRYSVLWTNINNSIRRGNSPIWNDTYRYSTTGPVPRRSHVVVPLETSFISGHQSTIFRDVHLNSSSLVCLEESTRLPSFEGQKEITFQDVVLQRCSQEEILDFDEAFPDWCLRNCKKIGEGVYGEVFSCQRSNDLFTVLKIMPVEGDMRINGEVQKTFQEILSEIVIAMELSDLRTSEEFRTEGFPEMVHCWCVRGKYPDRLLQLWKDYDNEKESYNDCPDMLPEDQVFIILELANVGTVLEGFTFTSPEQAWATFLQVTYTLAAAEAAFEFEHRDLHWGNILLKPTKARAVSCLLYGKEYTVQCRGLQASIIDFTLSRMTYDGCCIFNNMAEDPELFEGKGDFQFDVYRMMRDCVNNNWQMFEPFNNVLWLKYVLDKLITKSNYKNKSGKMHKKKMETLKTLKENILQCKSAREVAQYCRENL